MLCIYLVDTRLRRIGICGYEYIHGYPWKICGYGCDISYPRQPWETVRLVAGSWRKISDKIDSKSRSLRQSTPQRSGWRQLANVRKASGARFVVLVRNIDQLQVTIHSINFNINLFCLAITFPQSHLPTIDCVLCSLFNSAIRDDLAACFKVKLGDDNLPAGKKTIFEMLVLAEACTVWVLFCSSTPRVLLLV